MAGRIVGTLSPPEAMTNAYDRMLAVAQRIQLGVGALALLAVWVLPPERGHEQVLVTALLLGVYLPWTLISPRIVQLSEGLAGRVLNLALDLGAVGVFALLPFARTAVMLAFTLVIAFHAYVSGRIAGLFMAAASLAIVGTAEISTPPADRLDAFTFVMFATVLCALAVMVDALAVERRRTARHLGRLHRALESLAAEPSLSATTDSVADAARLAVGANAVVVLLPQDQAPGQPLQVVGGSGAPDDLRDLLRQASRDPERSPTRQAMRDGRTISIPDVEIDERTAWAAPTLVAHDIRGLVVLPLGPPSQPIGVLIASFDRPEAADEDDVHLLTAYARQASIAVSQVLAFEQERRAAARVAQADQLKTDFVSTVSHELRTPLTSVTGFIDTVLLQWDRLDDSIKKETLQRAAWNAGELRRLIEQVLDFAAVEGTDGLDDRHPFALRIGIDDLVRHMSPALRDCEVVVDVEDDLVVLASREAIQHVVGNLLTNASKFSPAGSTIRVVGRRDGTHARLTVTDEGPGVAEADRERIFDRFYRGSTTHKTRGTGIGLAIVRTSVQKLGGTVDLREGATGQGATFEVTLPLADASSEASVLVL